MGDAIVVGSTSDYGKEFVMLASQNRKKGEHVLLVGKDEDSLKKQVIELRTKFKDVVFNYKLIDMAKSNAAEELLLNSNELFLNPSEIIYCDEYREISR